ncbi:MAG: hypothetical protein GQ574_23980 [Crocinitomix sp.]|nr:hypothetical protein [Crocinitomix sp.]
MPIAKFEMGVGRIASIKIHFNNNSEGNKLTYHWNFGDGKESTKRNPSRNPNYS